MPILSVIIGALSADLPLDAVGEPTDWDVRRLAVEAIRGGAVRGLSNLALPPGAFDGYVVDRFTSPDGQRRIYLRPQVPFGGPRSA
jgi:hypothetical protein